MIRFDVDEGGDAVNAVLDARWTLLAGAGSRFIASRREQIEIPLSDAADPARRATALREALAMLATRVGDAAAASPDIRQR